MKRLKIILIAVMVCLLIFGLYLSQKGQNEYTKTEFVLDTTCSVTFYGRDSDEAADAVFEEVRRIENLMSMYKANSDVSRINEAKASEEIKVSEDTYKVIKTALEISENSDGAFDITVAPVTSIWNFGAENPHKPSVNEILDAVSAVGYKNITLKEDNIIIKLNSGTQIDLGGAAKGYAGDCALRVAKKFDLSGGIIDLGGNILCFGENPNSDNGKWVVGIQVPFKPSGTYNKTIEIGEGAVVTSGTYQRYFISDDKRYHHIIDPKTGYPSEQNYESVTVVLNSSLKADCLATAAYVMGREGGEKLIEKYNGEVYYEED